MTRFLLIVLGALLVTGAVACGGEDEEEPAGGEIETVRENLEAAGYTLQEQSVEELTNERVPILPGGFDLQPEAGFRVKSGDLASIPTVAGYAEASEAESVCADYEGPPGACQVDGSVVFFSGNPDDVEALLQAAGG